MTPERIEELVSQALAYDAVSDPRGQIESTVRQAIREASVPPEVATTELSEAEIDRLINSPPGAIRVVYPLDEEWNAAIEACAKICADHSTNRHDNYADLCAEKILALRRCQPQEGSKK